MVKKKEERGEYNVLVTGIYHLKQQSQERRVIRGQGIRSGKEKAKVYRDKLDKLNENNGYKITEGEQCEWHTQR